MRGWGDHLQLSVFECRLTRTELVTLKSELADIINYRDDQVLFVDLGPAGTRGDRVIEALGRHLTSTATSPFPRMIIRGLIEASRFDRTKSDF